MKIFLRLITLIVLCGNTLNLFSQSISVNYNNKKQQINMIGADMERSQSFMQKAANPQEIANWLFKDIAFTTCRVSYDKKQELVEGVKNFAFYNDAIKSMKMVRNANPTVKFYATMKSDYNGYNNENNLPDWICNYKPTTYFHVSKYAVFLADYLELMHNNGVSIDYLSVSKEWLQVITVTRTINIINELKTILAQRNIPVPLFTDPGTWSVDQGIDFVNEVISKSATNLFHAFSTHDYNNSAPKYPNFVSSCRNAGKSAWNDETSLGAGGRTSGVEPSINDLLKVYTDKAFMYNAGINGEIFFENFSRGVSSETRSIYFTAGEKAKRMRSYYASQAFANHINEHFFVPPVLSSMPNVKALSFVDNNEIALCVVNPTATNFQAVNINVSNTTINGIVTQHSFDSLSIIQGVKKQIFSSANGLYSANIKPFSLNFFRFSLQQEVQNETLTVTDEAIDFGLLKQNVAEKKSKTIYFNANNPTSDISVNVDNKLGNAFQLVSQANYSKESLMWFVPVVVELDKTNKGIFSADLIINSGGKSINIPMNAEVFESEIVDLPFVEMFPNLSSKATTITNSDLNSFSTYKGWEIHNGLSSSTDRINVTATETDAGYFLTPEINFDGPFELKFYARMLANDAGTTTSEKVTNNIPRNIFAVIGNDTIYNHKKNGATLYQNYNEWSCSFAYTGKERIKFFPGVSNQGAWQNIADGLSFGAKTTGVKVQATSLPTVNVGFGKSIYMGEINRDEIKTFDFPLKGWNLSSALIIDQVPGSKINIATKRFEPQNGLLNNIVNIEINASSLANETHVEKITLRSENNQIKERTIWLSFDVVQSTGNEIIKSSFKLFTQGTKLIFQSDKLSGVKIYSISGVLIAESQPTLNTEFSLKSGIYLVKVENIIRKIII